MTLREAEIVLNLTYPFVKDSRTSIESKSERECLCESSTSKKNECECYYIEVKRSWETEGRKFKDLDENGAYNIGLYVLELYEEEINEANN